MKRAKRAKRIEEEEDRDTFRRVGKVTAEIMKKIEDQMRRGHRGSSERR